MYSCKLISLGIKKASNIMRYRRCLMLICWSSPLHLQKTLARIWFWYIYMNMQIYCLYDLIICEGVKRTYCSTWATATKSASTNRSFYERNLLSVLLYWRFLPQWEYKSNIDTNTFYHLSTLIHFAKSRNETIKYQTQHAVEIYCCWLYFLD